jgi:hypothetical protein
MDKRTLNERCAELKARMLLGRAQGRGEASISRSNPGAALLRSRAAAHVEVKPPTPEIPSVELRNPHPLIKAALSAKHTGPPEYGRLQFRWDGTLTFA